jgi:hypothetical protein
MLGRFTARHGLFVCYKGLFQAVAPSARSFHQQASQYEDKAGSPRPVQTGLKLGRLLPFGSYGIPVRQVNRPVRFLHESEYFKKLLKERFIHRFASTIFGTVIPVLDCAFM